MSAFIFRSAQNLLIELGRGFSVVALTGPRQSGKTTLARQSFPDKPYQSLEDPDTRSLAERDPRLFLAQFPNGAVLDEIQRVPALFSYLQTLVDQDRRMGLFVVTGSQQFGLMSQIAQSLAGRVGLVELLPLSLSEIISAQKRQTNRSMRPLASLNLEAMLWRGAYPALHQPGRSEHLGVQNWLRAYVATYVERDVRQLLGVKDLSSFERFVRMCAQRSGQLLNIQALGADCGISHATARQWLSVLEASYVIRLLQPWHENFGKRLVKAPKLYFLDTGLLCWLLRIDSPESLSTHAMRGPVFETWVISETLKHRWNLGLPADMYFWRDNHGLEVDLLFEHKGRLHPVEIKSGLTFTRDWLRNLHGFERATAPHQDRVAPPTLVYGGSSRFDTEGVHVMPWHNMAVNT